MSKHLIVKNRRIGERVRGLSERRARLKGLIRLARARGDLAETFALCRELSQKCGRRASPVRFRRVCQVTGRSRGCYRFFQLSRAEILRAWARGHLAGLRKSSW